MNVFHLIFGPSWAAPQSRNPRRRRALRLRFHSILASQSDPNLSGKPVPHSVTGPWILFALFSTRTDGHSSPGGYAGQRDFALFRVGFEQTELILAADSRGFAQTRESAHVLAHCNSAVWPMPAASKGGRRTGRLPKQAWSAALRLVHGQTSLVPHPCPSVSSSTARSRIVPRQLGAVRATVRGRPADQACLKRAD
jgi:hypothetical protein